MTTNHQLKKLLQNTFEELVDPNLGEKFVIIDTNSGNNFLHVPILTMTTETYLDEIDIENDFHNKVREMDFDKNIGIAKNAFLLKFIKLKQLTYHILKALLVKEPK